jgi:hypothetical protein
MLPFFKDESTPISINSSGFHTLRSALSHLLAIAAFGFGFGGGIVSGMQGKPQAVATTTCANLERYSRLAIGLTQSQAELILQPGIEESRSATTSVIKWQNSDGSYIKATFEGNKLKVKEQKGLSGQKSCSM